MLLLIFNETNSVYVHGRQCATGGLADQDQPPNTPFQHINSASLIRDLDTNYMGWTSTLDPTVM